MSLEKTSTPIVIKPDNQMYQKESSLGIGQMKELLLFWVSHWKPGNSLI